MSNQDIQLDLNQDQAGQVVQQNVPAGAQTTLAFRVEQSKIPDFWGQEAKDSVTAIVFIRKIDDLARTNSTTLSVSPQSLLPQEGGRKGSGVGSLQLHSSK